MKCAIDRENEKKDVQDKEEEEKGRGGSNEEEEEMESKVKATTTPTPPKASPLPSPKDIHLFIAPNPTLRKSTHFTYKIKDDFTSRSRVVVSSWAKESDILSKKVVQKPYK
ncbi:hypothetical protein SK128_009423, partial [Halocaridina rubra]